MALPMSREAADATPGSLSLPGMPRPGRPVPPGTVQRLRWQEQFRLSVKLLWIELRPVGRLAVVGLGASAGAVLLIGVLLTSQVREHVMEARGIVIQERVMAVEHLLPTLAGRTELRDAEIRELDTLLGDRMLGVGTVRVLIWTLDGTILYSDGRERIGQAHPEKSAELREAAAAGVISNVNGDVDADSRSEPSLARTVEHYVALHDPGEPDEVIAIFESYEDLSFLNAALHRADTATRLPVAAGMTLMGGAVVLLLHATMRSAGRHREMVETREREFAMLATAADAVASSLDPNALLGMLQKYVADELGLDRLAVVPAGQARSSGFGFPLRDGTMLVAERSEPLKPQERDIVRAAANSLDAAIANRALFDDVRQAAEERQLLIRQVSVAHEEERSQIVGELHDLLASELIRTLYAVRRVALADHGPELGDSLRAIEDMVAGSEEELRAFMGRVRPAALDTASLTAAAVDVVDRFRRDTGLVARMHVAGNPDGLRSTAQLMLVRVLEEALMNVRKHAGAHRVAVALVERDGHVRLAVSDDGRGWPTSFVAGPGRGLGLNYLRERVIHHGGTLRLWNRPSGGARLEVRVPLSPEQA